MRKSNWAPSIAPNGDDHTAYIVLDDFGPRGRSWRETNIESADLEATVMDLLEAQYNNPVRVIAFDTAEKWSEDVSEDIAAELRRRCDLQMRDVPSSIADFVDRHDGRYNGLQLPLPLRLA
jgi:hypothetical protein